MNFFALVHSWNNIVALNPLMQKIVFKLCFKYYVLYSAFNKDLNCNYPCFLLLKKSLLQTTMSICREKNSSVILSIFEEWSEQHPGTHSPPPFQFSFNYQFTFFLAEDTWSAGSDSGTGWSVGVLIVWATEDIF